MSLVDGHCVLPEPIGWWCPQLDFLPSVAELFRLPPLKSGTLYWNTSSQLPRCSPSGATWKRFYYKSFCLQHFSGSCSGFGYLGRSKKSLTDWHSLHHKYLAIDETRRAGDKVWCKVRQMFRLAWSIQSKLDHTTWSDYVQRVNQQTQAVVWKRTLWQWEGSVASGLKG